jgi:hypothetical protein
MTTTYSPRTDSSPDTAEMGDNPALRSDPGSDNPGFDLDTTLILEVGFNGSDFRLCNCGCLGKVANRQRLFMQGHDQRLVGKLTRAAVHGVDVAVVDGAIISGDALGMAQHLLNAKGQAKLAHAVKVAVGKRDRAQVAQAEAPKPQPVAGTVKVGRWDYPAIREVDGNVVRNLLRDGTGEFVPADAKAASTFQPA